MPTIGSKLEENGGLGPGFDFLRVALALGVVLWHQPQIMSGPGGPRGIVMTMLAASILPMFFGLSGFLIAASALRLGLGQFLVNRALRIFPALGVEVVLCAFLFGPAFTALPVGAYFSQPGTYHYLTNILGIINFTLPGVFAANPSSVVNWSIWTVPCELACYGAMALMIASGVIRRGLRTLLFSLLILPAFYAAARLAPLGALPEFLRPTALYLTTSALGLLIPFLLGVLAYLYRYRIAFHWGLALLALLPVAAVPAVNPVVFPPLYGALVIALVYLSAFIGVLRIPPLPIFRHGDYSYGIYLYGAPVQQAVRAALPGVQNGLVLLAAALAAILALAMLSWHAVEKPVLATRKRFSFVARARGVAGAGESEVCAPPPVLSPATGRILTYGDPVEDGRPPSTGAP